MKLLFELLLYCIRPVEGEKLPAVVLEVVSVPHRGLFLDAKKELEVSPARWSRCIVTTFLLMMYAVYQAGPP